MNEKIERQKRHFDRIADEYYSARRHENHLLLKNLIWESFLSDKPFLAVKDLSVLEAMCGFAEGKEILERHLKIEVAYSGFDYSDAVIGRLQAMSPDLRVIKQDVTKFKASETYDLVILLGGLHHVPDAAAEAVRRLGAAVRPGGYFINLEPTSGNWVFRKLREFIYRRNKIFDETTERAFGVDELFEMFGNAGFSLIDAMYPGLMSYVMYYNPDAFPFLNIGGPRTVSAVYSVDRFFYRTAIGRALSFATLALWQKSPAMASGRQS